ncbi:MAG: alpha/beta hydrolase [Verrucomicrobiota bacterium JB023]|nr:alpha/beta hydrolase [Verrucomicrobiota bacterium JB023]
MMFAHGYGCDQSMWRFLAPHFEDRFQTVCFDYLGFGNSDTSQYDSSRYTNLEGYARDVVDIASAAKLRDIIFVGHSVSCMIGFLAQQMEPELFSHLILLVPSACYLNEPSGYQGGFNREDLEGLLDLMERNDLGWASVLAPIVMANEERPELTAELKESFCAADPLAARDFARATFFSDNREDLKPLQTPPLIIQCRDDRVSPQSAIDLVHQKIRGSERQCLPIGGHCPHMTHPSETATLIDAYLINQNLPRTGC